MIEPGPVESLLWRAKAVLAYANALSGVSIDSDSGMSGDEEAAIFDQVEAADGYLAGVLLESHPEIRRLDDGNFEVRWNLAGVPYRREQQATREGLANLLLDAVQLLEMAELASEWDSFGERSDAWELIAQARLELEAALHSADPTWLSARLARTEDPDERIELAARFEGHEAKTEELRHSARRMAAQPLASDVFETRSSGSSTHGVRDGEFNPPKARPKFPVVGHVAPRSEGGEVRPDPPYLARLVASLSSIEADDRVTPYLDVLDRVLEDRRVTADESTTLSQTACARGLTAAQVVGAHYVYMHAQVVSAMADGILTVTERQDLEAIAGLLGMTTGILDALVDEL